MGFSFLLEYKHIGALVIRVNVPNIHIWNCSRLLASILQCKLQLHRYFHLPQFQSGETNKACYKQEKRCLVASGGKKYAWRLHFRFHITFIKTYKGAQKSLLFFCMTSKCNIYLLLQQENWAIASTPVLVIIHYFIADMWKFYKIH
jgi:hypothetical protein